MRRSQELELESGTANFYLEFLTQRRRVRRGILELESGRLDGRVDRLEFCKLLNLINR